MSAELGAEANCKCRTRPGARLGSPEDKTKWVRACHAQITWRRRGGHAKTESDLVKNNAPTKSAGQSARCAHLETRRPRCSRRHKRTVANVTSQAGGQGAGHHFGPKCRPRSKGETAANDKRQPQTSIIFVPLLASSQRQPAAPPTRATVATCSRQLNSSRLAAGGSIRRPKVGPAPPSPVQLVLWGALASLYLGHAQQDSNWPSR